MEGNKTVKMMIEYIQTLAEHLVEEASHNPISSQQIRSLRLSLERVLCVLTKIETENHVTIEPITVDEVWRKIHYRGSLIQHKALSEVLNTSEKKVFNAVLKAQRTKNQDITFFDILMTINELMKNNQIYNLDKVSENTLKLSIPTLIQKLKNYCKNEIELRQLK